MAHRTHPSQPDEGLRQADSDPATLRILMERIAQWISGENPGGPITPLAIDDLAAQHAWTHLKRVSRFGRVDRGRHTALQAALMAALPGPRDDEDDAPSRPDETRGEYALRLRAAARP
ncbi:hypothetical protein [Streptomyces sp. NBC_01233]|uniref:hypothetical protein n=1 Tax=Streptomyces sp. NBC_01233 TaxID=2903787 RepID=UPI002E0FD4DD|nr:hypothetical protein OG332_10625 [Streptomyces sp. NBC_01233]